MTMDMTESRKRGAKPYVKPVLRAIELAADEVLGFGCKLEASGLAVAGDFPPCAANGCELGGS